MNITDFFIAKYMENRKVKYQDRAWLLMKFFLEEFKRHFENHLDDIAPPFNLSIYISFDDYKKITAFSDDKQLPNIIQKDIIELSKVVFREYSKDVDIIELFGWFRAAFVETERKKIRIVFSEEVVCVFMRSFDAYSKMLNEPKQI